MKIIVFLNQKGGSGKTTLAVHVATEIAARGVKTVVIDLDPQQSASEWADHRGNRPPDVTSEHAARLDSALSGARAQGYECIILDTAPHQDQTALKAARAADLIVIPLRPAAFDLAAIKNTLEICEIAKKPARVVINAAPIRSRVVDEAIERVRQMGGEVLPVIVRQRVALQHAVIDGRTAGEFEPDGAAAQEIAALAHCILPGGSPARIKARNAA